jgi:hypothetical protein
MKCLTVIGSRKCPWLIIPYSLFFVFVRLLFWKLADSRNCHQFFFQLVLFFIIILGSYWSLNLLGRCFTMLPALLVLVIFEISSWVYAQAGLNYDPSIYTFCRAGIRDTCHYYWLRWGLVIFFAPWWPQTMILLPIPFWWVARITSVSHHTWPAYYFYTLSYA